MFGGRFRRKGQHTLEIILLIVIIAVAIIAMQAYFKRSVQGKLKANADDIGDQFSPGQTVADTQASREASTSEKVSPEEGVVTQANETVTRLAKVETPALADEAWPTSPGSGSVDLGEIKGGGNKPPTGTGNQGAGSGGGGVGVPDDGSSGGSGLGGVGGIGSGSGGGGGGSSGGGGGVTGGGSGGGIGGAGGGIAGGHPIYDSSIEAAMNVLSSSSTGAEFAVLITQKNISVSYEDFSTNPELSANVAAYWDPSINAIRINIIFKTNSPAQAVASLIAHEGTHADYRYDPAKWIARTKANHPEVSDSQIHIPGNSIDQEYNCFRNAALLWQEVKNGYEDRIADSNLHSYQQGEAFFKGQIARTYAEYDLPAY